MAQGFFQWWHVARPTQKRLPAIAPRGGPGQPAGFEQYYAFTGKAQAQCRVQAAETAADDQYITVQSAGQRGAQR
ncbi:hypothetical protein D3C81_2014870 [compost metagenome]